MHEVPEKININFMNPDEEIDPGEWPISDNNRIALTI